MTVITSPHNEKLKTLRRLQRRRDGRFVAEGEDLLAAADAAGWEPLERFAAAGSGLPGTEVEAEVLAKVSALGSGTRALAVYRERWATAPTGPRCVALWGVRDPGNVGTVLRSALAFGADCVAIGPGTADPYGPKAVRASMGALFAVPVARVEGIAELPGERIALVARAGAPLAATAPSPDCTLVVGAEREGLPGDVVAGCDRTAHIPIASESLNAAMAATVALYELSRNPA
ncbi:TrmH family RNA methyltransferase [Capillimicrobium parvum]|uniref:23S rRNA (Guanosine-2'-O-)-methyltransferase RlmB n=1 Tax=Capillimicrobium parvum TaxID=2884022 RepID=A0A9E6XX92_9ACTN|nr:RNA methyltransferase [Capillimicrobium parvum]UGS36212.1 23S rRNA (guanosine-2'-O-)-methyltransferase RlmB [Capillimicrobium parvum]